MYVCIQGKEPVYIDICMCVCVCYHVLTRQTIKQSMVRSQHLKKANSRCKSGWWHGKRVREGVSSVHPILLSTPWLLLALGGKNKDKNPFLYLFLFPGFIIAPIKGNQFKLGKPCWDDLRPPLTDLMVTKGIVDCYLLCTSLEDLLLCLGGRHIMCIFCSQRFLKNQC